jgi:hypothetical protein
MDTPYRMTIRAFTPTDSSLTMMFTPKATDLLTPIEAISIKIYKSTA